ncbi:MAG: S24 family peptidase [Prevotellaceae bacterium]|nr:S24 family peptidase [Prevotellaceae bacterium]
MGTILTRIQEITSNERMTIGAMERSIGASKGVLSRAISNGTDIQSKWIQIIVENYPRYSPEWLLTGKGNMLKGKESAAEISSIVSYDPKVGQPYYDVDFLGGFSEVYNSQVSLPEHNIIVPGFDRANLWCNVTGHSMEPQISHGDIIALRPCTIADIQFGEIYAVVLDTIRTIKILRKGSSKDFLRYVPINPNFDEQEFAVSRIINVFEVIGSISKFF